MYCTHARFFHRFLRWPWYRFGDDSNKNMSRIQKRTLIIAASSIILATVTKNKKKKRRCCWVRTWVSEGWRQCFGAYHERPNEGIRGRRLKELEQFHQIEHSFFFNLLDKVSQSTQCSASPSAICSVQIHVISHAGKMCTDSSNT